MKTERDKLIELAKKVKSDIFNEFAVEELVDNFIKESINPRNEPDGHRRLEDNKGEKEVNKCEYCGSMKVDYYGNCKCFSKRAGSIVY